jgi:DUF4097 and DUF4098 domain-containing protein YvlB
MGTQPPAVDRALLPAVLVALLITAPPAQGQRDPAAATREWLENCDGDAGRDRERFCEARPQTVTAIGRLSVDGRQNGGVRVTGWDRNEVHIVARIQATGRTESAARELARQVTVQVRDGRVSAEGPTRLRDEWWSVSYDVYVPRRTDLDLVAHNGGLAVTDVQGRLQLETTNGGLSLRDVAGDVRGRTTNGGVTVRLSGDRWNGSGLDVQTTNGGVSLSIPSGYSARLEAGTTNGSFRVDYPITVQGVIGRRITTELGSGGAPIRVTTTNGGVAIRRS